MHPSTTEAAPTLAMILEALPERWRRLMIGTISRSPEVAVSERHLGLTTVQDNPVSLTER